jgi:cell division protease FtsH
MLIVLAAMLVGMWTWRARIEESRSPNIDYSQFYSLATEGKVDSVLIKGQAIEGEFKKPVQIEGRELDRFRTMAPRDDEHLLPVLRDNKVQIRVASEEQPFAVELLMMLLPWALIIGVWVWLSRRAQRMMTGAGPLGGFMKPRSRRFEKTSQVGVTFDDVAGHKAAKLDLQEVVGFLKEPERFRRLGGKVPRGVLLVGPPGTGKTLLARAVAGESGVPFFSISASEFIEMFVGVGAARVRELFEEAKKNAPAIIFIDEIDAVGRSRGAGLGGGHDEREQTLNQLLSEMDGFTRNDLTIVLAATNRPDVLDPALLRPGRFDRRVLVGRPELDARRAILGVHTKDKPLASDVNLDSIARNTPGFSGADLANLVNEAALAATRRGADSIAAEDFTAAYDKIVLGDPRESKLDTKEKRRVAVHESGHAVVAHFSEHSEPLHRVTIIPRGMALGVTQQTPAADRHIMTQPELESRLNVLMGGFAAERVVLGDISTGAENDLREATKLATKMVANYGMSKKLGAVYYEHESEHPFLGQRIATDSGTSDATIHVIESEARSVLARALEGAQRLVQEHRKKLEQLVDALFEQETIEREELVAILGKPVQAEDAVAPFPETGHAAVAAANEL